MDIALVTGASSALGLAISRRLIELGFRVYGLGGDYSNCPLQNVNFKPVSCDLADADSVEAAARSIMEQEDGVYVVVHNAKFFGRHGFSGMTNRELEQVLRINLLCPLVLVRTLMPSLCELQGYVVQLGSSAAETASGGPAGAAAAGGLKWMGEALFDELRDHGVKVCHLAPEPNRARGERGKVRNGARTQAAIDPEALAQAVEQLLQSPFGNTITELVIRPLRTQETGLEPVRRLPYPEPAPVPYTVPREWIEAEEQLEEEDFQKKEQERKEQRRKEREEAQRRKQQEAEEARRRRKQEEEERLREEEERKAEEETSAPSQPEPAHTAEGAAAETSAEVDPATDPEADGNAMPSGKSRRRRRRKPRPPMEAVGFLDPEKAEPKPASLAVPRSAWQEETDNEPAPAKKASRKTATKKAAKKAAVKKTAKKAAKKAAATKKAAASARKAATKKTAAKKAAKKAAATKTPRKKSARKAVAKKGDTGTGSVARKAAEQKEADS